jgi:hypothetical protein
MSKATGWPWHYFSNWFYSIGLAGFCREWTLVGKSLKDWIPGQARLPGMTQLYGLVWFVSGLGACF